MTRLLSIFTILILVFFTTIIKNSTKKIEEEIFSLKENIDILKNDLSDVLLEYSYLSSAEKLFEYQSTYFEEDFKEININDVKLLKKKNDELIIEDLIKNEK
mgnify:FL=1